MTLPQFNRLSEMEQIELFWEAVHIGERKEDRYVLICRQIEDFYVEYKIDPNNEMYVDLRVFRDTSLIEPYLEQIPLDMLSEF